ncbi:MMPL family transporter [Cytobacillus sp. IB215665]|uniref:MMPL family transporter n=1 Tax=Cytobacillus sp. IB215665 TaxID=3097357 RepID=UPI002A0FC6AD|nr:MMPL family transporter [Cytobacillus sp. IB215665]MDX8364659.1 MMPL family transporter [Cytobacillus sp. IB215665]
MKTIIKFRWAMIIFWLIVSALLITTMPNLDDLVREKGQPKIPDEYSSVVSNQLLDDLKGTTTSKENIDVVAVFHEDEPLTSAQLNNIEQQIANLQNKQEELAITHIATHFKNEELLNQFVSEDGTTVMAVISVDKAGKKVSEVREDIQKELNDSEVKTYLTGNEFINEDQIQNTGEGVKKTELFTVIFIILVLIVVFRSPITPIISLLIVALTYICSLSIVAHLVDAFDFPFSTTTQTFLILVLFGIGTDYNILLLSRFKEELSNDQEITEAIVTTYRTAGKTVVYSGLAVFIGFSILGFAQFSVFQSSVAVAVSVATLLLVLYTMMPFFMSVIGKFMFWPVQKQKGHSESRLWSTLGKFSIARPLISIIIVAMITIPFLLLSKGELSYNSIDEVNDTYESVQGFNILAEKFSPGKALPTTVVIDADESLDSNEKLALIDDLTASLMNIEGVETVYGPTRPQGEKIAELYIEDQVGEVNEGLSTANDGLSEIANGLSGANENFSSPKDFADLDRLINGTEEVANNMNQLTNALQQVNNGSEIGVHGARELANAVATLENNLTKLDTSLAGVLANYEQLQSGYGSFAYDYDNLEKQLAFIQSTTNEMQSLVIQIESAYPEVESDPNMLALNTAIDTLAVQSTALTDGLIELNNRFSSTNDLFAQANEGLEKIIAGHTQLVTASSELTQAASELADGLEIGSQGQSAIITNMEGIENGILMINDGQQQLKNELEELSSGMNELEKGLSKSSEGLNEISVGLHDATDYLDEVTQAEAPSSFFIPEELLEGEYQDVLNTYMSDNRSTFKLTVELSVDPYSTEAISVINQLSSVIESELVSSNIKGTTYAIGGISSINNDLNMMANDDFSRTIILMLVGIFVVLVLIMRAFWIPIFIIASLILSYYTALSMTDLLFVHVFGYSGLSWTIPFFSFIMIIALGVDYSIFLMMRFKENIEHTTIEALVIAKKQMGKVVISAATILCGTFAAMYPAGVLSLTQMATVVIIGLTLLTVIMLPVFIPALISLQTKMNRNHFTKTNRSKSLTD